jgi:hypothetical protein
MLHGLPMYDADWQGVQEMIRFVLKGVCWILLVRIVIKFSFLLRGR